MSGKNQFPNTLNWQSSDPRTGFVPNPNQNGSVPSGVTSGTMASTNTIYSNIVDVSKMDNLGYEVNWTGTPNGTLTVFVSVSGVNWPSLTFSPVLQQPAGVAGYYFLNIALQSFKYIMFQYVNSSSSGVLTISGQNKDLN